MRSRAILFLVAVAVPGGLPVLASAAEPAPSLNALALYDAAAPEMRVRDIAVLTLPALGRHIAPSPLRVIKPDGVLLAARANGIDPNLLSAVIQVESHARADAVSPRGARGLMQLMPATARAVGLRDTALLGVPEINIEAGARELRRLHARFGSLALVLAAYNAGEGAVARFHGVPPFAETTAYVARVMTTYRRLAGAAS